MTREHDNILVSEGCPSQRQMSEGQPLETWAGVIFHGVQITACILVCFPTISSLHGHVVATKTSTFPCLLSFVIPWRVVGSTFYELGYLWLPKFAVQNYIDVYLSHFGVGCVLMTDAANGYKTKTNHKRVGCKQSALLYVGADRIKVTIHCSKSNCTARLGLIRSDPLANHWRSLRQSY